MCRNAKKKKLNADCEKYKNDSSGMWKVINEATNKKPKRNTYPDYIEVKDAAGMPKKVRDRTEIANAMNKQFSEMGGKLASKLPPTNVSVFDYL